MKAVVVAGVNQLEVKEVEPPRPASREALVSVHAAALNHRDVWIWQGQYAGLKYPCIPGSDGAGVVVDVGADVDRAWVGREVIINPSLDWGENQRAQSDKFSILGLPRDGTMAEHVVVPVEQLAPKPPHLSWEHAAALPLAGLTAYRALFSRATLKPGEKVLISGIGGGVATFALQFAAAAGAEVWVTSSSAEKIQKAVSLGAQGGFDYKAAEWTKGALAKAGSFAVIVDGAGGPGFEGLVDVAAPGARIVVYGATRGNPPGLPMRKIFWRQISLLGSTMGSPHDWAGLVKFIGAHSIGPVISKSTALSDATDAFQMMKRGEQFGKLVLRVA